MSSIGLRYALFVLAGRSFRGAGSVGHGRAGGLRPTAAALLPRHRRATAVLRRRQPGQLPERHRQVGARAEPLLPAGSRRAGLHEGRPEGQQEGLQPSRRAAAEARLATTGPRSGPQDQRSRIHGVFGEDTTRRAGGVRASDEGVGGQEVAE